MKEGLYIEKHDIAINDPYDIKNLKVEAIEMIQKLSGNVWTDFNIHDPGITILEELCYVLTELFYKCGFPVEDYLADAYGAIDYQRYALYQPEDIYPSAPITIDDYKRFFFDAIDEIDQIWIEKYNPSSQTSINGLYRVTLRLRSNSLDQWQQQQSHQIKQKLYKIYSAHRNLGEDLEEIVILQPTRVFLSAEIALNSTRSPAAILAEVYYKCQERISGAIRQKTFKEAHGEGVDLEDLLTGPRLENGFIATEDIPKQEKLISLFEISGIMNDIDGIKKINNLSLEAEGKTYYELPLHKAESCYALLFPNRAEEQTLQVTRNGVIYPVNMDELKYEYIKLAFPTLYQTDSPNDISRIFPPVKGKYRTYNNYYSLQEEFPSFYGIGTGEMPESASALRKKEAHQLKAYLLHFEQIIANFLENIEHIPDLFSVDTPLSATHFYRLLDEKSVPKAPSLYLKESPNEDKKHLLARINQKLKRTVERYDNASERQNRLLDYLLSLYGESCNQKSLQLYYQNDSYKNRQQQIIQNKIHYLKNLDSFSRDRALAFNYLKEPWQKDNCATLQKKTLALLGVESCENQKIGSGSRLFFHLVEHVLLRPIGTGCTLLDTSTEEGGFWQNQISVVLPNWIGLFKNGDFQQFVEETIYLNTPAHLHVHFIWLDAVEMEQFETVWEEWLRGKKECHSSLIMGGDICCSQVQPTPLGGCSGADEEGTKNCSNNRGSHALMTFLQQKIL